MSTMHDQPYFNDLAQDDRRSVVKDDVLPKLENAHAIGTGCQSQPSSAQSAQPSTLFARARSMLGAELGGRYRHLGKEQQVVGATPNIYPQQPANSPSASNPVPDEPPLGIDVGAVKDVSKV